jgi:hypothetical protein
MLVALKPLTAAAVLKKERKESSFRFRMGNSFKSTH